MKGLAENFLDSQRSLLITPSKEELAKTFTQKLWDSFQLGSAYLALNAFSHGFSPPKVEPMQMANGAALTDWEGHLPEGLFPEIGRVSELGLLWAILGQLYDRVDLKMAARKVAHWQKNLLDHRGFPFAGIWTRGDFSLPHLLGCNTLLFGLDPSLAKFQQLQNDYAKGWDLPSYLLQLAQFELGKEASPLAPLTEEITVGMLRLESHNWSTIFALTGFNSGMGALHKNEVALVNFGPQVGPLDDLDRFGISRPSASSLKDISWEKGLHGGHLQGWTKIHGNNRWIELKAAIAGPQITLSLRQQEPADKLKFVFYIRAHKAQVGAVEVHRGSLDRYVGRAMPVKFWGEKENLCIEPCQEGQMEVIPLSGGDFFWNSDFLLAFAVDSKVKFTFNVL